MIVPNICVAQAFPGLKGDPSVGSGSQVNHRLMKGLDMPLEAFLNIGLGFLIICVRREGGEGSMSLEITNCIAAAPFCGGAKYPAIAFGPRVNHILYVNPPIC